MGINIGKLLRRSLGIWEISVAFAENLEKGLTVATLSSFWKSPRPTRNHHHRPSVGGGVGEPGQAVDTARARDDEKEASLAGKIADSCPLGVSADSCPTGAP